MDTGGVLHAGVGSTPGRTRADYLNIAAKSEMTAAKITRAVPISRRNVPSGSGDGSGALRVLRSCIVTSTLVMGDGLGIALITATSYFSIGSSRSGRELFLKLQTISWLPVKCQRARLKGLRACPL